MRTTSSHEEWRVDPEDGQLAAFIDGKRAVWAPQPGSQRGFLGCPIREVLYEGNRGPGKGLTNSTPVLTDLGWVPAGEVTYQHQLIAPDGAKTKIVGIFPQGEKEIFRIHFKDGAVVDCDGSHRWWTMDGKNQRWKVRDTDTLFAAYAKQDPTNKTRQRYYTPTPSPVPGNFYDGPDPYIAGYLLGDGTLTGKYPTVYTVDDWTIDYLTQRGWRAYDYESQNTAMVQCIVSTPGGPKRWFNLLGRKSGDKKSIPQQLLNADPHARLATLQGLMDSDGSVDKDGRCTFGSISKQLSEGVQYLVRSLGGKAKLTRKEKHRGDNHRGGRDWCWNVTIQTCNKFNPFRMPRKRDRVRPLKGVHRTIEKITKEGIDHTVCFAVAHPSHQFVIKDFVVTHNTDALLMDFAQFVGRGYKSDWLGILFRRKFPELQDVIKKSKKWFPQLFPGARYNESKHLWNFPDGEQLYFSFIDDPDDYHRYHGWEVPWLAFEELTNWPSDECFRRLMSINRCSNGKVTSRDGPGLRIRSTCNPSGPGHTWVKARYNLAVPYAHKWRGHLVSTPGEHDRLAIKGKLIENKILLHAQPDYIETLRASAPDDATLEAWLEGNWEVISGGMFTDRWDARYNILPAIHPQQIPRYWRIDRSYDHGQSRPFSCGWWAQSNGEPITLANGRQIGTVRGDLIRFAEFYGWSGKPNEGLRMSAEEIASEILERERRWGIYGRVNTGIADANIFDQTEPGKSIAAGMRRKGVKWKPADKAKGSRKHGWEIMRTMMKNAHPQDGYREAPGLFVTADCNQFLRTVPVLTRDKKDPDDVDTDAEDHIADETRYRCRAKIARKMRIFQG